MKIGIVFTAYNCDTYITDSLRPWIELKNELDIIISVNSGMFKDYIDLGFEEKNKNTLSVISNSNVDFLATTSGKNLLDEDFSRNISLEYLKRHNCDLIWAVDGDEIYTKEEIKNTLKYIESHPNDHSFSVEFKNYTFEYPYFTKGFRKPIIYRNNINHNNGISHFTFDTYIKFNNGVEVNDMLLSNPVPKKLAFVSHYSWINNDSRTKEKIKYQNIRYVGPENKRCAFVLQNNKLKFNKEFFEYRNMQIPIIYKEGNNISYDFEFSYVNSEKKLTIDWVLRDMNVLIKIFEVDNLSNKFEYSLQLTNHVKSFLCHDLFNNEKLKGFIIEVWENGILIHNEELHLSSF